MSHNGNFLQLAFSLAFMALQKYSKNLVFEIMIPFLLGFLLAQYPQHMHKNSIEIDLLMAGNGFGWSAFAKRTTSRTIE